jgi:hypothetical protein
MLRRTGGRTLLNAGSVGMPFVEPYRRGGGPPRLLPWSEYAIVDAGSAGLRFELRRVAYDFEAFAADVEASGMPDPRGWIASWVR